MTTVQEIQAQIEQFKSGVVSALDGFVRRNEITQNQADRFLAGVGIERPEAPEVREAREALTALKAAVRSAVEAQEADEYRRRAALLAMGL